MEICISFIYPGLIWSHFYADNIFLRLKLVYNFDFNYVVVIVLTF